MAKGNPNPKKKFVAGNTAAVGKGRPPLDPEIKEIASNTKLDISRAYFKISKMSILQAEKYKPETILEAGMLKVFENFIRKGYVDQMCRIWAEVHGKPRETFELTGNNGGPLIVYLDKQDENL